MITYSFSKDRTEVTAHLTNCEFDAIKLLQKRGHCQLDFGNINYEVLIMKHEFEATAVCHPEDTFDIYEGMKIAKKRVLNKYDKNMKQVLKRFGNVVNPFNEALDAANKQVNARWKK